MSFQDHAISHTFPVWDDMNPKRSTWFSIVPSPYGVIVNVYKEQPQQEKSDWAGAMASVQVDYFGDQLKIIYWQENQDEDEPGIVPLVETVSTWRPEEEVAR